MIKDYLSLALGNLFHRKLRSWLTMVGIFIGVAAVVALFSLGQGLENSIKSQFQALGTDKLFISAKGGFGQAAPAYLYTADVDVVKKTTGVKDAIGIPFSTQKLVWNGKPYFGYMLGVPVKEGAQLWDEVFNYKVVQGRALRNGDTAKAVVGYALSTPEVASPLHVGNKVTVQGRVFEIVGVYEKIGDPTDDHAIYVPVDTYREITSTPDRVDQIEVKIVLSEDPKKVAERVTKELRKHRGLAEGKEDFAVQTPDDILAIFSTILNIVIIVLVGIAGISLVVGSVGIMNTMYTAVLERTREIGIMKAIGARNADIFVLFFIESGLLGLAGWIIGVLLGMGVSKIVEFIVLFALGPHFLLIVFPLPLIFGALAFSFIVGALSGVTPAYRASRMNPVDALTYN